MPRHPAASPVRSPDPDAGRPPVPLKERLLLAAIESLRDLSATALLTAVGTREIARRAGGSAASINHHYGSLSGLAAAVVERVFDPATVPMDGITALIEQIKDANLPLEAAFAMHGAEFDRLTQDPDFHLRMGLWALGGEEAAEPYRTYLRTLDARVAAFVQRLFASWDRQLRPPFDATSYAAVKVALLNGNTLRHLVDPEPERRSQFQRASVALDMVLLRVAGDTHSTDDRLAEMNYYPLDVRRAIGDSPQSRATHARILQAAAELFTARGYATTTLHQVALQSGVSLSTLHRHFATKHELAVALFRQQARDRLPPVDRDTEGVPALRQLLTALTSFVHTRTSYAAPYLYDLLTTTKAPQDDPVHDAACLILATAREGVPPQEIAELASLLVGLTVRRALLHPAEHAASTALHVLTSQGAETGWGSPPGSAPHLCSPS